MWRRTLKVLTWPCQKARPYFVCFRTATEKAEGESWKNKDSGPIGLEGYCRSPQWLKTKTHYKYRNSRNRARFLYLGWGVSVSYQAKVMGKSPMKILLKGSCAAKGLPVPWISHFATAFGSCQHAIVLRDVPLLSVPSHVYCMYLQSERGRETHGGAKTEIHPDNKTHKEDDMTWPHHFNGALVTSRWMNWVLRIVLQAELKQLGSSIQRLDWSPWGIKDGKSDSAGVRSSMRHFFGTTPYWFKIMWGSCKTRWRTPSSSNVARREGTTRDTTQRWQATSQQKNTMQRQCLHSRGGTCSVLWAWAWWIQ